MSDCERTLHALVFPLVRLEQFASDKVDASGAVLASSNFASSWMRTLRGRQGSDAGSIDA
jgi:hypothetical protein